MRRGRSNHRRKVTKKTLSCSAACHIAPYKWAKELSILDGAAIENEMDSNVLADESNKSDNVSDCDSVSSESDDGKYLNYEFLLCSAVFHTSLMILFPTAITFRFHVFK